MGLDRGWPKTRKWDDLLQAPACEDFGTHGWLHEQHHLLDDRNDRDKDVSDATTELQKLVNEQGKLLGDRLARLMANEGRRSLRALRRFERRHSRHWGEATNLLEGFRSLSISLGSIMYHDIAKEKPESTAAYCTLKLHARGCLVSGEIIALIRCGFADAALARWRSLHECTATSLAIMRGGDAIAKRYLDWDVAHRHKAAKEMRKHPHLSSSMPTDDEFDALQQELDQMRTVYPKKDLDDAYGWVRPLSSESGFRGVESAAGISHLRSHYQMASYPVHANSRSLHFTLILNDYDTFSVVGPSNSGHIEPAQCMLLSLQQLNTVILTSHYTADRLVLLSAVDHAKDLALTRLFEIARGLGDIPADD